MEPLENKHKKYINKINASIQLCKYLASVKPEDIKVTENGKGYVKNMILLINSNKTPCNLVEKCMRELKQLQTSYNSGVAPHIFEYFQSKHDESVYLGFNEFVETENILGKLEHFNKILMEYAKLHNFNSNIMENINKLNEQYNRITIKINKKTKDIKICPNCSQKMTIFPELSELRCGVCSFILQLDGAIFDDSQFYTQQVVKVKEYVSTKHCDKWIKCIQTKENRLIPPIVINKLDALAVAHFTRKDKLQSMQGISCSLIRAWLKDSCNEKGTKLTNFNNHAALIRRMITALHGDAVIPPQLSYDEEEKLLLDFSRAMAEYDNIECIHIQSDDTLVDNDVIWGVICNRIPDFIYEPTDRNFIFECS